MRERIITRRFVQASALLLMMLLGIGGAAGQGSSATEGGVSAELLNLKISEVEAATNLDEPTAAALLELYRQALTNLEIAQADQSDAEAIAAAAESAPDELRAIQARLEETPAPAAETPISARTPLAELERRLAALKVEMTEAESRLGSLNEEISSERLRPAQARERLGQARKERDAVTDELGTRAPGGDPTNLGEARRWNLLTRSQRLSAEIRKLEQELLTHDGRLELLSARRELTGLELEQLRDRARLLEDLIGEKRSLEAERARQQAIAERVAMAGESAPVRELAAANVELGDQLARRMLDIEAASDQRDLTRREVTRIERELSATESKLEIAGLKQALGSLLLENRRGLPSLRSLDRQYDETLDRIADVGLEGLLLEEESRALRDLGAFVDEAMAGLPAQEAIEARSEMLSLAESRADLVAKAIDATARYQRVLGELDLAQVQLADIVESYDNFLESRLLWVRTTAPLGISTLRSLPDDAARLVAPTNWLQFIRLLASSVVDSPVLMLVLALLLALALLRPAMLKRVDACARQVGRIGTDRFSHSLRALMYTGAAAAGLPLLLVAVGSGVSAAASAGTFSNAASATLIQVGTDLLVIQFFLDACRRHGLLATHCNWPDFTVRKLRGELTWFRLVFPLASLVAGAGSRFELTGNPGGLEVVATVLAAAALALLIFRLFTPSGGILRSFLQERSGSLLAQARPVWLAMLASIMPLLVVLGLMGYIYTADVLANSYMLSFWVVLGLMMLQGLLSRWLLLGYQRLEYEASLERWQAERAAREAARKAAQEEADFEVEEPRIDFAALNKDSRVLLKTILFFVGALWLWVIWAPIVPAFNLLENIPLWSHTSAVDGQTLEYPITLADLLVAIILGIATGAAAKGLPALVEMALLRRTNMTPGGRYAASTLLRYSIIGIGGVIVIGVLGVSWSNAQWLVAALGVGIGFGLQEIVANFVSGLVILFERPVRVGDVVTVGETSGVVTRIQIRATTIRDFNRREMLVPNKEMITSRLLNWSLSDEVIRLVIPIGIDYGSDVGLGMKLAEEAAREHPEVVDDPAPFVIFEGFGENALEISLRVYLPSLENRLTTMSELHSAIRGKYKQAGVVFAFPQREVHLHSADPLDVRLRPAED